jgi:hypothetical protein
MRAMKKLWSEVTLSKSMILPGLIAVVCLVGSIVGVFGFWYVFWPSIIIFVLSCGLLIQQGRDEKKHEREALLVNIRLQRADIVAQEMLNKPYFGGPVANQYPSAPPMRKPVKMSAPPVKRQGQ